MRLSQRLIALFIRAALSRGDSIMRADTKYGPVTEEEKKHIIVLYYNQMNGIEKIKRKTGRSIVTIKRIINGEC